MNIEAPIVSEFEAFLSAREKFDEIVARLTQYEPERLAETEEFVRKEGLELQRRLLQARLDVLFERERAEFAVKHRAKGLKIKGQSRQLETQFGRVFERRHGLKEKGKRSEFPLDVELNVPGDMYSHPLRRRVAEAVIDGSFDRAIQQIERTTAGHVPKRQTQELTARAAQDVEVFYAEQPRSANDTLSDGALLVLSSDGCAIRMVQHGLREPTRRANEKAETETDVVRGDPTAAASVKPHQTRRAVVTAVWEQERHERTAADVVANLKRDPKESERRKKARGPRPQNKRVTASVEQDQCARIVEMFDEADRRDPNRERETVVLVDGDEHQTETIQNESVRRGRSLTLVLDLLHAMHYLWVAATALKSRGSDSKKEDVAELVTHWTVMLLTSEPYRVIAAIRAAATRAALGGNARNSLDVAADYLLKRTPFINYRRFIASGLPIATGVIEGACRYVVRDRLDITGARWNVQDAEAVLRLRAVRASGDWDEYWKFHEQQEARRNYARAA